MSVASLSIHTLRVLRPVVTEDDLGGRIETFQQQFSVSGRVQPLSGAEQKLYSKDTEVITHRIYVAGRVDIRHKDRIRYTDSGGTVKTYEVKIVRNVDEWDRHMEIDAELQT